MRLLYIVIGSFSLIIGMIGVILPVLPTTPFLLLTAFFYTKGSKRFSEWFQDTKLYKHHLQEFIETKTMTKRKKRIITLFADAMILLSIIRVDIIGVRILLVGLLLYKYYYFHKYVTVV